MDCRSALALAFICQGLAFCQGRPSHETPSTAREGPPPEPPLPPAERTPDSIYWPDHACGERGISTFAETLRLCVDSLRFTDEGALSIQVSWTLVNSGAIVEVMPLSADSGIYLMDKSREPHRPVSLRGAALFGARLSGTDPVAAGILVFDGVPRDALVLSLRDDSNQIAIERITVDSSRRSERRLSGSALAGLSGTERLTIDLSWSGLGKPFNLRYELHRSASGMSGQKGGLIEKPHPVSVSHEAVAWFLASLSEAPLFEASYVPQITHTDDYPKIRIEASTGEWTFTFLTESQGNQHVPWALEAGGKTYVVPSDHVARSLHTFLTRLDPEQTDWLGLGAGPQRSAGADTGSEGAAFRIAIQRGDTATVRRLLAEGADARRVFDYDGEVPLTVAALYGNLDSARLLIGNGADVNAETPRGTAIGIAVFFDRPDFVRLFLDSGADPSIEARRGWSLLELATLMGHRDIVRILTEREGEASAGSGRALYLAATAGDTELVQRLLVAGADVNAQADDYVGTPLMAAVQNGHTDTVSLLLEGGANVEAEAPHGATALSIAVSSNYSDIVRLLLDKGADPNRRGAGGWTPLMSASGPEVATALLDAGAAVEARDDEGRTPFTRIAIPPLGFGHSGGRYRENPKTDVVGALRVLLEAGADPDARDERGRTALIHFVGGNLGGPMEVLRLLLASGARVDAADDAGRTALFYAATPHSLWEPPGRSIRNLEEIRTLLEAGADPRKKDGEGRIMVVEAAVANWEDVVAMLLERPGVLEALRLRPLPDVPQEASSALESAAGFGHFAIARVALASGANPNALVLRGATEGTTLLLLAAERGHLEVVRLLLDAGADPLTRNRDGLSARDLATARGHSAIAELLASRETVR